MGEPDLKAVEFTDIEASLVMDFLRKDKKFNSIVKKIENAKDFILPKLYLTDVKTGKQWSIDFIWFAFPGLKNEGYRVEGFHQTGEFDGIPEGECMEFGSIVLVDGELKVVNW